MLPIATALASSLGPKIIDAISSNSDSNSQENPSSSSSGPMLGDNSIPVSVQTLPPAPPPPLGSSLGNSPGIISIPFQDLVLSVTGETSASFSQTIAACHPVKRHSQYFRDCWVSKLEAVIFPSASSLNSPVTVDLAWTPADVIAQGDAVLATPGSARLTVGGLSIYHQGVVSCDLGHINSIIKSAIPYTNSPRLNVFVLPSPKATTDVKAVVVIRGLLHCSHPILTPGNK